jgi:hypothetical protein
MRCNSTLNEGARLRFEVKLAPRMGVGLFSLSFQAVVSGARAVMHRQVLPT